MNCVFPVQTPNTDTVEMLQTAGTSYAMANAAPGIDKYATHVTDSVEKVLQQIIDELPAV